MTSYNPPTLQRHTRPAQAGFTLVEIMVGLVIGMLASLVIIQVVTVFEAQRRTTTGTADAQTNGGIALYSIGRELQMAGYPLMPTQNTPLKCTGGTAIGLLAPVTIVNGNAAEGDTVTVSYGTSPMGGVPTTISADLVGDVATVNNNLGCKKDDAVIIINGTNCNMTSVTEADSATPTKIKLAVPTGAVVGASLACVGNWGVVTYAVVNGVLTRNGVPTVDGVVGLQAQYGVSASVGDNKVDAWVNANATNGDGINWATPSVTDRNRIKAIRIAVVARNAKMEPAAVTTACSSTTTAAPTGLCAWEGSAAFPAPTIDLSGADANWARYRYRVFETIIPLRNVIWARSVL